MRGRSTPATRQAARSAGILGQNDSSFESSDAQRGDHWRWDGRTGRMHRTLADHGFPVSVFEKSRGVAGRMATRRAGNGLQFDHGAQYFTVSDQRFRSLCAVLERGWLRRGMGGQGALLENGMVRSTNEEKDRYVGVPGMNAVGKHLATDLTIHTADTRGCGNARRRILAAG